MNCDICVSVEMPLSIKHILKVMPLKHHLQNTSNEPHFKKKNPNVWNCISLFYFFLNLKAKNI